MSLPEIEDILSGKIKRWDFKTLDDAKAVALGVSIKLEKMVPAFRESKEGRDAWNAAAENVIEFAMTNFELDAIVAFGRAAIIQKMLPFDPVSVPSYGRFAKETRRYIMEF